jgi:hypothetical protein
MNQTRIFHPAEIIPMVEEEPRGEKNQQGCINSLSFL